MDDPMWASFSVPLLETMCEDGTVSQQLSWSSGLQPPRDVKDAINCPNHCSGNGHCSGRECVCNPGFSAFDCSHFKAEAGGLVLPPYLYMAANNSICDVRQSNCSSIQVLGQDFLESSILTCSFRQLNSDPDSTRFDSAARFVSDKIIECMIASAMLKLEDSKIFEVRVLTGGGAASNEVFLTLVDSSCAECPAGRMPQHPTVCHRREAVCRGGSRCYPPGALHPRKPCLVCRAGEWKTTQKPVFARNNVSLEVQEGDSLVYNLEVSEPGARLKLNISPTGLVLKDTRVYWTAALTNQQETVEYVEIVAETSCRSKETLKLWILVLPCRCKNNGFCIKIRGETVCDCQEGFSGWYFEQIKKLITFTS